MDLRNLNEEILSCIYITLCVDRSEDWLRVPVLNCIALQTMNPAKELRHTLTRTVKQRANKNTAESSEQWSIQWQGDCFTKSKALPHMAIWFPSSYLLHHCHPLTPQIHLLHYPLLQHVHNSQWLHHEKKTRIYNNNMMRFKQLWYERRKQLPWKWSKSSIYCREEKQ